MPEGPKVGKVRDLKHAVLTHDFQENATKLQAGAPDFLVLLPKDVKGHGREMLPAGLSPHDLKGPVTPGKVNINGFQVPQGQLHGTRKGQKRRHGSYLALYQVPIEYEKAEVPIHHSEDKPLGKKHTRVTLPADRSGQKGQ